MEEQFYFRIEIFVNRLKVLESWLINNHESKINLEANDFFFEYAKNNDFKHKVLKDCIIEAINNKTIKIGDVINDNSNFNNDIISKTNNPVINWGENVFARGNIKYNLNGREIYYKIFKQPILH